MRHNLPAQLDLPNTEQRPAELAKRIAASPLRPTTYQLPCDHGLFGDEQLQIDLEEILG